VLGYSTCKKNNKTYYFITLNHNGLGLQDEIVSDLFNVTTEEYVEILTTTGGRKEDNRGYIFDTIEGVELAIVSLKMLLTEP
jgi:hypothetical protein